MHSLGVRVLESAPSLRVNPMPPRITQKSHRPRASHRMMVGTYANGWLAQLRNEWCRDRCMKPLKGDQQLRSVSLSYSVALQALEPKSSPRRRRAWMQAPIEVSRRGVEKCFCLTSSLIG